MRKLLWQDQSDQGIDFIDPRVAQLRWLAIKRGFIQHLPNNRIRDHPSQNAESDYHRGCKGRWQRSHD
jgi:hypothetical protein